MISDQKHPDISEDEKRTQEYVEALITPLISGQKLLLFTNGQLSDSSRIKSKFIFLLIFLLCISVSGNVLEYGFRPDPKVVAQDAEGRITPIKTLDEPVMTAQEVGDWTARCLEDAYTLRYDEISQHRNKLTKCFKPKGINAFQKALNKSGFYQEIKDNFFLASAVRKSVPVIADQNVIGGNRYYVVEVPLQRIYRKDKKRLVGNTMLLVAKVWRVSLNESKEGIQIGRISMRPWNK